MVLSLKTKIRIKKREQFRKKLEALKKQLLREAGSGALRFTWHLKFSCFLWKLFNRSPPPQLTIRKMLALHS